jgi:palmitoyltransferase
MQSVIPVFLLPVVVIITIVCVALSIAAFIGFCVTAFYIYIIGSNARRERLARFALSRQVRSRKSWQALALTVRLATMRLQSARDSKVITKKAPTWERAWQEVSRVRADQKSEAWLEKLDFSGSMTRMLGPVVVFMMWTVLGFAQYGFFAVALPWYELGYRCRICVLIPTVFVAAKVFYDYAAVMATSPGHPQHSESPPEAGEGEKVKWCRKCEGWKPPRAHHCRICRRCISKMDHHCVFTHQCIGKGNYRYFVQLLADIVFGAIVMIVVSLPQLYHIATFSNKYNGNDTLHCLILAVGCFSAVVGLGLLGPFLWYHIQCVLRNETTLERMKREKLEKKLKKKGSDQADRDCCDDSDDEVVEKPMDYGRSPMENFGEVFGMPPVWARGLIEPTLCWLTSSKCGKRKD